MIVEGRHIMETLANLESFVRSAEEGSFSGAARRMALTPAAISRNVAFLEKNLGVRLFQRSTRNLTLTEAGERFLANVSDKLEGLQAAISDVAAHRQEPAGVLRVSLPNTIGADHILPLLPAFLARYPAIKVDWHFANRQVDLIKEGFDIGIGGGFALAPGIIARPLAPTHIIAVAAPSYLAGRIRPVEPSDLAGMDGIVMRSESNGRVRHWTMRDNSGREMPTLTRETIVMNDPLAMVRAAILGLGVTFLAVPDVASHLASGALVRLIPCWYADAGAIHLYYSSRTLSPAKIRAFVEHVLDHFKGAGLADRFSSAGGGSGPRPFVSS
jgi:DNA-binding transcriptional LysR family regulator